MEDTFMWAEEQVEPPEEIWNKRKQWQSKLLVILRMRPFLIHLELLHSFSIFVTGTSGRLAQPLILIIVILLVLRLLVLIL